MKRALISTLIITALAAPAHAGPEDHRPALLSLLGAFDSVPSAAAVKRAAPEAEDALYQVATDSSVGVYLRRRATSLLSLFPGETSAQHLRTLSLNQASRIGALATYTFIRIHGQTAPRAAHAFAQESLRRDVARREAVIRALRHVPGEATEALIERHAAVERDPRVRAAIRRHRQWKKR